MAVFSGTLMRSQKTAHQDFLELARLPFCLFENVSMSFGLWDMKQLKSLSCEECTFTFFPLTITDILQDAERVEGEKTHLYLCLKIENRNFRNPLQQKLSKGQKLLDFSLSLDHLSSSYSTVKLVSWQTKIQKNLFPDLIYKQEYQLVLDATSYMCFFFYQTSCFTRWKGLKT